MNRFRHWSRQRLLTGALALALLFVQTLGMLHGVLHAGLSHTASPAPGLLLAGLVDDAQAASTDTPADAVAEPKPDSRLFDARHSCASFDAATLGAALQVHALVLLLQATIGAPAAIALPVSKPAAPPCHFLSRAPPFFPAA